MGEIIAVTSGKGGVGKSSVCIHLGMMLASKGYKICLVDADLGLKNLDLMMGLDNRVIFDMQDVVEERCLLERALLQDKREKNLYLLPVGKGGNLDWHKLVQEAGLQVVSLHTDLGSLERDAHAVAGWKAAFALPAPWPAAPSSSATSM